MYRPRLHTALLAAVLVLTGIASPAPAEQSQEPAPARVITEWNRVALRTVYTEAALPIPVGTLYLGFSSLATYDAVREAADRDAHGRRTSTVAAAAVAAHDVLVEYFPASAANLQADLSMSLQRVGDGPAKARGIRVGRAAADALVASRVNDGRPTADAPSPIVFDKPPAPGVWRPTPPGNAPMAVPWLGFVEPLVLDSPQQVKVHGPDALTSFDYAADFLEAKWMGALESPFRTAQQTETALFFNSNAAVQYVSALADALDHSPAPMLQTARMFAVVNAAIADALIVTWRLKYDVGFWRPITAIHQAATDGNPATEPDPTWQPLINRPPQTGNPPYPENASGHATLTNAFTTALARLTGQDRTNLRLYSTITDSTRRYTSLAAISHDAFNARIWLGIHFRQGMLDGQRVGQVAARIVDQRLP